MTPMLSGSEAPREGVVDKAWFEGQKLTFV